MSIWRKNDRRNRSFKQSTNNGTVYKFFRWHRIIAFCYFFIVTLVLFADGLDFLIVGISAIITIILLVASILLYEPQKETGRYEYQCIISDEVLFVDMYEKYEVVSRNGELWTIRDREVPNVN